MGIEKVMKEYCADKSAVCKLIEENVD